MKKLSLNIKKIALSLLVVGLAVGFSAFEAESNKLAGEYVKIGTTYFLKSSRPPTGQCNALPANTCSYTKTNPSGDNITDANFTASQPGTWTE